MRYLALFTVVLLSACTNAVQPDSICPQTGFVDNSDTVTYLSGTETTVRAAINGFKGDCTFADKEKKTVELTLTLPFEAQKGATAAVQEEELPYFIAVLSPEEKVLQRQAFTTKVGFGDSGRGSSSEEHTIRIPLAPGEEGAYRYKVVVGFVLTHEQLDYNREHQ